MKSLYKLYPIAGWGSRLYRAVRGFGVAVVGYWVYVSGAFAQISPGPLSRFHQKWEGMAHCVKCHKLGEEVTEDLCLSCHMALQERRNSQSGYHSSPEVSKVKCSHCHPEHHGRSFELINYPRGETLFDHQLTGWSLQGAHVRLECRACHNPAFIDSSLVARDPSLNLERTKLGLQRRCLHCHEDEHQGQLKDDCLACHNQDQWRPAPLFDHQKTKYPLVGRHQSVNCQKCHPSRTSSPLTTTRIRDKVRPEYWTLYKGLSFSRCADCHHDPHQGRLGKDCEHCHSLDGFTTSLPPPAFDHSKTRYPLTGKHQLVSCQKCHLSGRFTTPIPFSRCQDCHQDVHSGQFSHRPSGGDCEECHTVEGFFPSQFSRLNHNQTRFPLEGAHRAVWCRKCHDPKGEGKVEDMIFRWEKLACRACHLDPHQGQADAWMQNSGCESCHSPQRWDEVRFDHNLSRFILKGGHQKVGCGSCHRPSGEKGVVLKPLPIECEGCHKDPHYGQFLIEGKGVISCDRCHISENWKQTIFNHNRDSRFALKGAHERVTCQGCHPWEKAPEGQSFRRYKPLSGECKDCHSGSSTQRRPEDRTD